jgi:hypothetical protein
VYYGYVNRLLVVVGDFTTNGLNKESVGIEKSVGVEWLVVMFILPLHSAKGNMLKHFVT